MTDPQAPGPTMPAVDPAEVAAAHAPDGDGGRVWKLPDDVDTDALAPGKAMAHGLPGIAPHCLGTLRPEFARGVRAGDLIVAGERFGIGSSREQAAAVLRHLGVAAVLAPGFAGLFHRNAINLGLPVLVCPHADALRDGERVRLDLAGARILRLAGGEPVACEPLPPFLLAMIEAGGLLPLLRARLARGEIPAAAPSSANTPHH